MKRNTKLLALLLTLAMVLSVFASCTAADPTETTAGETTPAETTPEATTPAGTTGSGDFSSSDSAEATTPAPQPTQTTKFDLESLIPPAMNLDREMNIFVGTLYDEEWLTEDDGDLVGTELYNRVPRVENNLGIEFTFDTAPGTVDKEGIMNEIAKRQESTDPNMISDLCSTYSQWAGSLTLEGRYQNIANSDYVNFDNPWWPDDLIENSTLDDKVYFVSGDISPTLLYEVYAIFYNRELVEKYNLENPIELVNNYEWTFDKLIEITEGIYEDLDEVKGPSVGDFIAFNFCDGAHIKAFPFAMGVRVLMPDDENGYVYDTSYTGEKMDLIADKFISWVRSNNGVSIAAEYYDFGTAFRANRNIFNVGNFGFAKGEMAGSGIDYGVVPCPMYDEDQGEYFSYYGNPSSFWGIPTNADLDDSSALLEALAADAYVYISPALFERALKIKYVTNEVDGLSHMFDIIRDGIVFDACMMYNAHIAGYTQFNELNSEIAAWSSIFTTFMVRSMNNKLKTLVNTLRQLP